ncbi:hypothetical protein IFM89_025134 [Coptis chinensis]|uniref:Uncharacterized protein n=1 Tax=Coptis chinensis TaxID=261450 RepID=A0A835IYC6_9MAGN|nr:hypothetical protein IFM89_025134 [Coptis chinensis]
MRRGACCGEKAVLVTVFVERPTRRRVSSNHHPNKIHHPITQAVIRNRGGGRGYDRKAELLRYSHCLRESARSTSTTPLHRPAAVASSQAISGSQGFLHLAVTTCL